MSCATALRAPEAAVAPAVALAERWGLVERTLAVGTELTDRHQTVLRVADSWGGSFAGTAQQNSGERPAC